MRKIIGNGQIRRVGQPQIIQTTRPLLIEVAQIITMTRSTLLAAQTLIPEQEIQHTETTDRGIPELVIMFLAMTVPHIPKLLVGMYSAATAQVILRLAIRFTGMTEYLALPLMEHISAQTERRA